MIFRRREKLPIGDRLRNLVWPGMGWKRTLHYYRHRLFRVGDSGYRVAMAAAIGVAASFSPLLGLHNVIAIVLAWAFRANIPAALLITNVFGNPFMVGFFVAASIGTGHVLIDNGMGDQPLTLDTILHDPVALFGPPMLGWAVLGLVCGFIAYRMTLAAVHGYHHRRQKRLRERAEAHRRALGEIA